VDFYELDCNIFDPSTFLSYFCMLSSYCSIAMIKVHAYLAIVKTEEYEI
jgi:hypothetical protein